MECVLVGTSVTGKMDLADLNAKLLLNNDKPAIINVNIGIYIYISCIIFLENFELFLGVFFSTLNMTRTYYIVTLKYWNNTQRGNG